MIVLLMPGAVGDIQLTSKHLTSEKRRPVAAKKFRMHIYLHHPRTPTVRHTQNGYRKERGVSEGEARQDW